MEVALEEAEDIRLRSLTSFSERCAYRVERAKRVAKMVREEMESAAEARKMHLEETIRAAQERRALLLEKKAQGVRERLSRGKSLTTTEDVFHNGVRRRMVAAQRRRSLLEERRCMAVSLSSFHRRQPAAHTGEPVPQDVVQEPSSSHSPLPTETIQADSLAVKRIQRAWRLFVARKLLREAGLDEIGRIGFDEACELVKLPNALRAAFLIICAVDVHRARDRRLPRILLSCLLIARFPEHTIHTSDSETIHLLRSSRRMTLAILIARQPAFTRAAWLDWSNRFIRWQQRDAAALEDSIIQDAVASEQLRDSLQRLASSSEEATELNRCIDERLCQIRQSLSELWGRSSLDRLDSALEQERRSVNDQLAHEITLHPEEVLDVREEPLEGDWRRFSSQAREPLDLLNRCLANIPVEISSIHPSIQLKPEDLVGQLPAAAIPSNEALSHAVVAVTHALRALQSSSMDSPLEKWQSSLLQRLERGNLPLVDLLRELYLRVRRVKTEVSVYRIRLLVPTIQGTCKERERARFERLLENDKYSRRLPRTRQWLSQVSRQSLNLSGDPASRSRSVLVLVCRGLVDLVFLPRPLDVDLDPEVLDLDIKRLRELQDDLQRVAVLNALNVIARDLIRSCVRGSCCLPDQLDFTAIDGILRGEVLDPLPSLQDAFASLLREILLNCCAKEPNKSQIDSFRAAAARTVRIEDPVFQLIQRRMRIEMIRSLDQGELPSKEQLLTKQILLEHGSIHKGIQVLQRIASHAMAVHAVRFLEIACSVPSEK